MDFNMIENNDLDDLDNLMGGDDKPARQQPDDDLDFFGGGNDADEEVEVAPKKKSNDPLAFLQRAQAEKQNKAE